jgi:hypothetical protein
VIDSKGLRLFIETVAERFAGLFSTEAENGPDNG